MLTYCSFSENVKLIKATRYYNCVTIIWDAQDFKDYGDNNTEFLLTLVRYNNETKSVHVKLQNQAVRICRERDKSDFVRVEYVVKLYQVIGGVKFLKGKSSIMITKIQDQTVNMGKKQGPFFV